MTAAEQSEQENEDTVKVFAAPGVTVSHGRIAGEEDTGIRLARIDVCALPHGAAFDRFLDELRAYIDAVDYKVVLQIRHVESDRLDPPDMPSMLRIASTLFELGDRFHETVCGTVLQVRCIDAIVRVAYDAFVALWTPSRPIKVTDCAHRAAELTRGIARKHHTRSLRAT